MTSNWNESDAVHLLNRAAFAAGPQEAEAAVKLGKRETVRRLTAGEPITGQTHPVLPIEQVKADGRTLQASQIRDQQTYWIYRMANTSAPLIEKMTLFWHGHFATSYAKVHDVSFMVRQNHLFREQALGSFREMVQKVSVDPAMMKWLDANSNRKGRANENYAREVMELFTLGLGHYSENDVKAAARALTGWHVSKDGTVAFHKQQHDGTVKTILGHTGRFGEQDFIELLFEQPALSEFMALKLLQFFATPNPPQAWVQTVAEDFRKQPTVGQVMTNLFLSEAFYEPQYRMSIIKSPADYVIWFMRILSLPLSKNLTNAMKTMGQELYYPPDVAGWRRGDSWLMTSYLMARSRFAETAAQRLKGTVLTSAAFTPEQKENGEAWVKLWIRNLGMGSVGRQTQSVLSEYASGTITQAHHNRSGLQGLLNLLMISPEAQMV